MRARQTPAPSTPPRRERLLLTLAACGVAGSLAFASPRAATAQTSDPNAALEFAVKGLEYFKAGDYERAYVHFDQAELRQHAPPHLLYMARAQRKRGLLLEARDLYQRIVVEELGASAPEQFRKAQEDARAEYSELSMRIPGLRIIVKGVPEQQATVRINGNQVSSREFGRKELNPGRYEVEASAPDAPTVRQSVVLAEGETKPVELTLEPRIAPARPGGPAGAGMSNADGTQRGSSGSTSIPAIVAYGVGVAGLGVGLVTGLMSLGEVGKLQRACGPDKTCTPAERPIANRAKQLGDFSTAGFIVGGVGIATGTVLLLTFQPGSPSTDPALYNRTATTVGLNVRGDF